MFLLLLSVHPATLDDIVFKKVNEYRATKGLKPYHRNKFLDQAALDHAKYQLAKGEQTHTGPPGLAKPKERFENAGYKTGAYAENVAFDIPPRWQWVMKEWLHSSGHEPNIANPKYEDMGVGSASSDKIRYWTQTFSEPGDESAKLGRYEGTGDNDETTGYVGKGYEGVSITPSTVLPKWFERPDGKGHPLREENFGITWDDEPTGTGPGTGKPGTGKPGGGAKTAGADKTAGAGADKTAGAGAGGATPGGAGKTAVGAGATPGGGSGGAGGGGAGADKTGGGAGAGAGGAGGGGATPGGGSGAGAGGGGADSGNGPGSVGFDSDCGICRAREVVPLIDKLAHKWLNE